MSDNMPPSDKSTAAVALDVPNEHLSELTEKHHVGFGEAATVSANPLALTFPDPAHSWNERPEITIDHTKGHRLVSVSHTAGENRILIISARAARPRERRQYEEGNGEDG